MEEDEDYGDRELLERARRLCIAATQLNLPVIKMPQYADEGSKKDTPEPVKKSRRPQSSGKKAARPGSGKAVEKLPELQMNVEQRKLREAERVRQAQERARARVARSNQHEQLEAEREQNSLEQKARQAAERIAEQEKLAEESRLRAEERIRAKRQMQLAQQEKNVESPPGLEKRSVDAKKLKMFRRTTYERLLARASEENKHRTQEEEQEQPHQSEEDENRDFQLKQRQKKLRQETAERLRRMELLHEEQQRQEQENVEKGLQLFKNRQRELDRVAKGFAPAKCESYYQGGSALIDSRKHTLDYRASMEQDALKADDVYIIKVDEAFEEVTSVEVNDTQKGMQIESQDQDHDLYPLEDYSQQQSNPCNIEQLDPTTPSIESEDNRRQTQSSGKKNQRRKMPSWKLPPVPILPKECYSSKALVSSDPRHPSKMHQHTTPPTTSDSYTDKFLLRRTNAL